MDDLKIVEQGFGSVMHLMAYASFVFFNAYYWQKQIWPAIKGWNGKIQKEELINLIGIWGLAIHVIEFLFNGAEFNIMFALFVLACVAITQGGKITIGDMLDRFSSRRDKKKDE